MRTIGMESPNFHSGLFEDRPVRIECKIARPVIWHSPGRLFVPVRCPSKRLGDSFGRGVVNGIKMGTKGRLKLFCGHIMLFQDPGVCINSHRFTRVLVVVKDKDERLPMRLPPDADPVQ